jgi:hypothetical protein
MIRQISPFLTCPQISRFSRDPPCRPPPDPAPVLSLYAHSIVLCPWLCGKHGEFHNSSNYPFSYLSPRFPTSLAISQHLPFLPMYIPLFSVPVYAANMVSFTIRQFIPFLLVPQISRKLAIRLAVLHPTQHLSFLPMYVPLFSVPVSQDRLISNLFHSQMSELLSEFVQREYQPNTRLCLAYKL